MGNGHSCVVDLFNQRTHSVGYWSSRRIELFGRIRSFLGLLLSHPLVFFLQLLKVAQCSWGLTRVASRHSCELSSSDGGVGHELTRKHIPHEDRINEYGVVGSDMVSQ